MFLGQFSTHYDTKLFTPASPWGPLIMLVPVIGAVCVTYLVTNFAPEAKGHGVPEVMDSIYYGGGVIRPVVAAVKSLASAVAIGTGATIASSPVETSSSFASAMCCSMWSGECSAGGRRSRLWCAT